jgi:ABC-type amino acid transport substrate-binding protein
LFAGCTSTPASDTTPTNAPETNAPAEGTSAKWRVLSDSLATEEYAIGFRKEDVALTELVNNTLIDMAAEGTLGEISTAWFGRDVTTIPVTGYPGEINAPSADDNSAQRTTFILGLDASFPPMGYTNDAGEIVGFDIDVAKALCSRLGWELKLQSIDWDAKELELSSGNIDCIWNGMTKTDERDAAMSLSLTYMDNEQVIVVLESSGITSLAGMAGKKLILQAGSSAEEALESNADFKAGLAESNTIADNMTAFMDVEQGASDGILLDSIVANWYISENS